MSVAHVLKVVLLFFSLVLQSQTIDMQSEVFACFFSLSIMNSVLYLTRVKMQVLIQV